jgi:hypothetical protein
MGDYRDDDKEREREPEPDRLVTSARVGAAVAMVTIIVAVSLLDVFLVDYEVQPVTLGILMAGLLTLLGLEARDIWRGR